MIGGLGITTRTFLQQHLDTEDARQALTRIKRRQRIVAIHLLDRPGERSRRPARIPRG